MVITPTQERTGACGSQISATDGKQSGPTNEQTGQLPTGEHAAALLFVSPRQRAAATGAAIILSPTKKAAFIQCQASIEMHPAYGPRRENREMMPCWK